MYDNQPIKMKVRLAKNAICGSVLGQNKINNRVVPSMKILVAVKRVVDYNVRVRVKADESGVELANVKMSINPFCEIAVEEAVKLKTAGKASEVVAVSIGDNSSQETLRVALARGADKAILVKTEDDLQPLAVAKTLQKVVEKEQPDMVLMGKQSIDGDNNQTGQMLAALLGWGQSTFASKIELDGTTAHTVREVDGGLEKLDVNLPAVITADLRLNTPSNVTLPNLMKAKQKPLDEVDIAELGVDTKSSITTLKVTEPPKRSAGVKVENVEELVQKLKEEARIL